jgi:CBS domain-containing protein
MAGYVMFRRRLVPVANKGPAVRRVSDVMSRAILTITRELSLGDALAVMIGAGTRHLVVVNGERRCSGVLSDRDVAAAFARDPSALTWQRARDVVGPPAMLDQAATVGEAARAMCSGGVDAVAVVDAETRPVGIVTAGDLVALLADRN